MGDGGREEERRREFLLVASGGQEIGTWSTWPVGGFPMEQDGAFVAPTTFPNTNTKKKQREEAAMVREKLD